MTGESRRLSSAECAFDFVERRFQGGRFTLVLCCRGTVPSDEEFADAVHEVARLHPLLSAAIVRPRFGKPRFVAGAGSPPSCAYAMRTSGAVWRDVIEAELNGAVFSDAGPLLRVVFIRSPDARSFECVFTVHHSIADTRSLRSYAEQVVVSLARDRTVSVSAGGALTQPVDARLSDEFVGVRRLVRLTLYVVRAMRSRIGLRLRQLRRDAQGPAVGMAFVSESLSITETNELVAACRGHGPTVTGALGAAWLRAASNWASGPSRHFMCLGVSVDLSTRVRARVDDAVSMNVSGLQSLHQVDASTSFWDLAREISLSIDTGMRRGDPQLTLFLQRLAYRTYARQRRSPVAVLLSSLGPHATLEDGPEIVSEHCAGSMQQFGGPSIYISASTVDGRLHVDFSYPVPVIARSTASTLLATALSELRQAMQDASAPAGTLTRLEAAAASVT